MVMLGISPDKHKLLIDSGFWTPTNEVFDETKVRPENSRYGKQLLVDTFEYLYKNGTKSVKEKNIDKIKEMLKTGNSSVVEINFAFVIEGQTRLLPYDKLREVVKTKTILNREGSNDLGFPIHIFRTL